MLSIEKKIHQTSKCEYVHDSYKAVYNSHVRNMEINKYISMLNHFKKETKKVRQFIHLFQNFVIDILGFIVH